MRTVSQGSRYSIAEIDDTKILNSILRLSLGRIVFNIDIETEIETQNSKVFSNEIEKEALKVTH